MMRAPGFTLIEMMIASAILIAVLIVIYAVFGTADSTYRNESSLRTAQLNAQRAVDSIVVEATESGRGKLWAAPIAANPAHPVGLSQAFVFVSARGASGSYTLNGLAPRWQKTVVVLPLPAADGTFGLARFEAALPDVSQLACASVGVTVTAADVTVSFNDAGGAAIGVSPSALRASGKTILSADIQVFSLQALATAGTDGGLKNTPGIMQIGVQIQVRPPQGAPLATGYMTTIRGRN